MGDGGKSADEESRKSAGTGNDVKGGDLDGAALREQ